VRVYWRHSIGRGGAEVIDLVGESKSQKELKGGESATINVETKIPVQPFTTTPVYEVIASTWLTAQ
jgi:hypothetical protein